MKNRTKSRWKKIVLGLGLFLAVLVIGLTIFIKNSTYQATDSALKISQSATQEKNYDYYTNGQKNDTALIFYPGALVVPASYSEWAQEVATKGYDVYVVRFPLNLAVLAPNAAEQIIKDHPQQNFVLAGHSLGGVMASRFVAENEQRIKGMIYLASYPDEKGALNKQNLPVLSITATNDGVLNWTSYQKAKQFLPKDTQYVSIEGGNHAGFGNYGVQKGDNKATISNEQQQTEISQLIVAWLQSRPNK
ncbi:alpha/beta hydrolase [Enterococcus faecalis]|uniref:alpha/beta hydrolase n=1 Tax=Enterococcus faecalis TaxID=1351 RepID=UPI00209071A1|nr:alpha/beta hydrolase [Enterococcus faecalis]MCO5395148.1 alpha/beta hydrolase [Enterococcus faecalis]